ncbi:hypothetical protein K435DRAFT_910136 [Dendrothele bispora CBS 962.96]|uniref:Uncharacterized protein n=1 Tax=Dendrothele bispora (strain CBS 962.96) TaxID=1314807 RepID=A0A4S8LNJ3_DENBC|nr:hypothetical protein K435DRAFT_910136 [Dendrothele bispora CBS 962.96]
MSTQPQNGSDNNLMGQMERGPGTGGLVVNNQEESTIDGPSNLANDNTPPAEAIRNTLQLDEHTDESEKTPVDGLGRPNQDEAPSPNTSLHDAHSTDQRQVDARNSVEGGQLGTDASRDNGSNLGDGNERARTGRREHKQVGSKQTEDAGREQTEEELDIEEVVGTEQSQTPDKPGDRLSGTHVGGGTTGGRNEDIGGTIGSVDKSVDSQLMGDRSWAESERTEGKREGKETGAIAEAGTSKIGRYEDDGTKIGMRHQSWSEAIPSMSGTREPGVDEVINQDTGTEQRVSGGTGRKEDTGGLAGAGALSKENSEDDRAWTAVTGMPLSKAGVTRSVPLFNSICYIHI